MRLTFKKFDGRSLKRVPVVDEDTGAEIGYIQSGVGGIEVSLFDGKYSISVKRYDECWGFVKGVESVLQRRASLKP